MKKLLIGIFFLGLTNLAFAQASSEEGSILELDGITVMPVNMGYFTAVLNGGIKALKVVNLQKSAASHDITKTSLYNGKERFYSFTFKQRDGFVRANYNQNGKITHSFERYKDIAFPLNVRQSIYEAFPGWATEANLYVVSYTAGHGAKKMIKVKLVKDGITKRIKVDTQGKIL